jgi:hypothetical protein
VPLGSARRRRFDPGDEWEVSSGSFEHHPSRCAGRGFGAGTLMHPVG